MSISQHQVRVAEIVVNLIFFVEIRVLIEYRIESVDCCLILFGSQVKIADGDFMRSQTIPALGDSLR